MKLLLTSENFVKITQIFRGLTQLALLLAVISGASTVRAQEGQQAGIAAIAGSVRVGEISLVLGKAFVERPSGPRELAKVGSIIRVSDLISTAANGHVHIRFDDEALVSVRPDSRLEVVRYDYDASRPEKSTVKFNLVEGVTRSISGKAASSARQRFRMNTPIAAIGVRGTDFVVSASEQSVRALVNEGVIVLAPFSENCTMESFGPCAANAVELTGESLQILEFNAGEPAVLPASHERDPGMMREEVQLAVQATTNAEDQADERAASNDAYLENVTSPRFRAEATAVADLALVTDEIPQFTPDVAFSRAQVESDQLVWGRWAFVDPDLDVERISVALEDASLNREITVANFEYGLFRLEETGTKYVDSGLGLVSFGLNSAQAFYHSAAGTVPMDVRGGELNIDFDQSQFATLLQLEHQLTGAIDFEAAGRIWQTGYFVNRTDSKNIAGAVSIDGTEAGYFFDQQLESGSIDGLTLWGR